MTLLDKLDSISKTKVETKLDNDQEICSALLYSVYFLYKDFPKLFDSSKNIYLDIKSNVLDNFLCVNNGADKIMGFYFLNELKVKNTDFGKVYSKYLELLLKEQEKLGVYAEINVYKALSDKIKVFEERAGVL